MTVPETLTLIASLILLALALGAAIYLSLRYSSGKFSQPKVADYLLIVSCLVSLCFVVYADLIDIAWLIAYAIVILLLRLVLMKRSFRETEMILHLTMIYISLSRLDKVDGYGHPNQYLVTAQYIFLITIVVNGMYLIYKLRSRLAICSLLLLMFPVSHFPLEIIRNMAAQKIEPRLSSHYVTKIYTTEIYGLKFKDRDWVDRFSWQDGRLQKTNSSLLNDGGGTMSPQVPMLSSWEWRLVKKFFAEKQ